MSYRNSRFPAFRLCFDIAMGVLILGAIGLIVFSIIQSRTTLSSVCGVILLRLIEIVSYIFGKLTYLFTRWWGISISIFLTILVLYLRANWAKKLLHDGFEKVKNWVSRFFTFTFTCARKFWNDFRPKALNRLAVTDMDIYPLLTDVERRRRARTGAVLLIAPLMSIVSTWHVCRGIFDAASWMVFAVIPVVVVVVLILERFLCSLLDKGNPGSRFGAWAIRLLMLPICGVTLSAFLVTMFSDSIHQEAQVDIAAARAQVQLELDAQIENVEASEKAEQIATVDTEVVSARDEVEKLADTPEDSNPLRGGLDGIAQAHKSQAAQKRLADALAAQQELNDEIAVRHEEIRAQFVSQFGEAEAAARPDNFFAEAEILYYRVIPRSPAMLIMGIVMAIFLLAVELAGVGAKSFQQPGEHEEKIIDQRRKRQLKDDEYERVVAAERTSREVGERSDIERSTQSKLAKDLGKRRRMLRAQRMGPLIGGLFGWLWNWGGMNKADQAELASRMAAQFPPVTLPSEVEVVSVTEDSADDPV